MAFKLVNLSCIGNNAKSGVTPKLYMYFNEDSDTVTTAGFIPAGYDVKSKDQFMVVASTGLSLAFYNATVDATSGVVTLKANTAS